MYSISDLKVGTYISINSEPYVVTWVQHTKIGRGGAILRTKVKNLISGTTLEKTYKGADKIEEADLVRGKATFLYKNEGVANFMDTDSYEQFTLEKKILGEKLNFLKEGMEMDMFIYNNRPIMVEIPIKVELQVVSAPPAVRGDTAQGSATKTVELETGATVNAPIFIKQGDVLRINTETGEYVERVSG